MSDHEVIASQLDLGGGVPGGIWKKGEAKSETHMPLLATVFFKHEPRNRYSSFAWRNRSKGGRKLSSEKCKGNSSIFKYCTPIAFLSTSHETG